MNFLKSIKINIQSVKTTIIGNSAAFFVLIAIAVGYSLFSMNQIGTELKSIAEKDIPLTQNLTEITMLHIKQAVEFERAFRFGEQLQQGKKVEALFAEQVTKFNTHGATIDQTIEHVEVLLEESINESHSEVEAKKFAHFDKIIKVINQSHNNYVAHADEVYTLLSDRKLHEAELLMEKVEVEEHQLETRMESLFTEIEKFTNVATKTAEKHEQDAVRMLSIISVVALLLSFGLTWQMIKSIRNPLARFTDTVNKLRGGDDMARVGLESANEFGQLSTTFDKMLDDRIEGLAKMADCVGQIEAIGKSQAVIEFNMDGTVIMANELFTDTMDYKLDEIKGQHHSMFVESGFKESVEYRQFWEKLNRGEYEDGEYKRIGKGGKEVWLWASYNPILDMDGKPFKVVKYASDITKQKLENANTSGQIKAIGKSQAVIEFNMDGTIITANDLFTGTVGYSLDEIKGQHHSMFVEPEFAKSAEYRQFWEKLNRGEYDSGEYKRIGKGGKEIWLQASYNPIMDLNGKPFKVVKYATEITEQKLANVENQRTKTALDQVNTNIMMADKDLNIIYMNGAASELFTRNEADFKTDLPNFNASKLLGTNIDTFHKNPSHQRGILSNITQTIEAELNIGTRIMKAIVSPVNDEDGNRLGTVVEWVDRTEEKARLESEAKEAAANGRVKTALDQVNSNVMMADADLNIIYMNKSATQLFNRNETDFRKDLPNFETKQLVGSNIDIFHKNPAHQRGILQNLTQTIESELELGGRSMQFVASPVNDDSGQRLGTVVEWIDRTDQEATEQEVNSIVQAASSGNFSERIEETGKEGFFERLAIGINQVMQTTDTSLNDVVRVLQSLSQGDLTHSIEADYQGLFGQLKADLNTTVSKLSDVLGNVNSSVSFIANSSEEVSSTAQSLAQGASEQAASVEETSASIEQMSASINQNNENAKVTNDIASQSATQAVDGGEAVKETVSAMNQIASKIGIIEDIAYQTNILALNAAIEAARAGEHGKGFAVVAAEVRKLAERSQISATEISELASTSVTIAEQAGKLLEEIVPGINKTAGLVQEISAASDEQASGATQITNAMSQLDQVTQQTASASEELTATSEGMRNQSRSLLQQIGFFKLDENDEQVSDQRGPDRPFSSPAKDTAKFVVDNHPDDAIDESHFSKFS